MAGGKGCSETGVCKYCNQNVVINGPKCVKCVECESVYHSACSERIKNLKVIDVQKKLIECCSEVEVPSDVNGLDDVVVDDSAVEIKYLKALLAEKDARIADLTKINNLLEQKIGYLERDFKCTAEKQSRDNKRSDKDKNVQAGLPRANKTSVNKDKQMNERADNLEKIVNKQKHLMNEIVNLGNSNQGVMTVLPDGIKTGHIEGNARDRLNEQWSESEWEVAEYRHRRRPFKDIGVIGSGRADPNGKIAAPDKRAWLYVGRIADPDKVSEQDLLNYMKGLGDHHYTCEKIDSSGSNGAFKISVPFVLMERATDPDFWPAGVIVRRFNFPGNKRRHFLEKTRPLL